MNLKKSTIGRRPARLMAAAFLTGTIAWTVACYPEEATSVLDYDTVATFRDDNFQFGNVTRFAMPDTVLDRSDEVDNPVDLTNEYDALIISQVRENLFALGWQESKTVDDPAPEVVVILGKVGEENVSGGIWYPGYPGWGWWYPPCFGCGGYWPPTVVTYTWETGTMIMTMFDGSGIGDGDNDAEAVWIGGLNGVLSSSASGSSRITKGIDQAFSQSPYLRGSGS